MKPELIMREKCATCPFREGSPVAHLADDLAIAALTHASRICHSTGGNSLVIPAKKNYHRKGHVCRGSRDIQLKYMATAGVIKAPTDEAWAEARSRL